MRGLCERGNEPLTLYSPTTFLSNAELFAYEEGLLRLV